MSSSLTFLCIVLCIVFVDPLDVCYSDVDIRSKYSNSTPDFQIFTTSPDCTEQFDLRRSGLPEPELCPPGLLSVDLSPLASPRVHGYRPHVQLNISVIAHSTVSDLFARLECVYAPNGEDVYCHNDKKMIVNGVWLWPCRGVSLGRDVDFPIAFGYSCFRLFGLSQYLVNVTAYPQNCRNTFLITSPAESQLFPSIADFYGDKVLQNLSSFAWTPVLFVDLSETDGVWFRVAYPSELARSARVITVSVFKIHPESHWVESFNINYPKTGIKWFNVAKGTYAVYAFLQRHDCSLPCSPKDTSCVVCVHTQLNFTIPHDLASLEWRARRWISDLFPHVLVYIVVVCSAISVMLIIGVLIYIFVQRLFHKERVVEMPLEDVKKVHIIYSDDCAEHAVVILELTRLLEASRAVKVSLDQRDLLAAGDRPSNWVVNSIKTADLILLAVSPCTQDLINGKELNSKRPYPDLFKPSYDIFMADWAQSRNRSKFALLTLPYSPTMPYELSVLNLHSFPVPDHLGDIMLFIRGETPSLKKKKKRNKSRAVLDVPEALLEPLLTSIELAKTAVEGKNDWDYMALEAREPRTIKLAEAERKVVRTAEEQKLLADELGIEPPDQEGEEGEDKGEAPGTSDIFSSNLVLLPPDETSNSDTD